LRRAEPKRKARVLVALSCEDVRRQVSNYVDRNLAPALRRQMENHARACARCKSVLDGTRNVALLLGSERGLELAPDRSRRLYSKLDAYLKGQKNVKPGTIRVGITEETVPLGSHLIYFWENDQDFNRGVRFLHPGLGQGEHCIIFGHDEALEKVLQTLRSEGFDPDQLVKNKELTVLRRRVAAQATLAEIAAAVEGAMRAGATAVRFLGNLGMGRDPLPAGEDDVVELENKATALISPFPCVIVCMYDVRTLSGHLIMRGGLQAHHLTVCGDGVRENPYYLPEREHSGPRHVH